VKVKPLSAKQRGEKATLLLRETLDLPVIEGDATVFGAALAEAASEESMRNVRFAEAVRERYRDLLAQQPAPKPKSVSPKEPLPPLVPIRRIEGYRADPFSPPNPQFLIQLYGYAQLDRALQDYTPAMLKETAAKVQQDHPGTKPTSKAAKQALIDYIVKYSDA
jgi:hypothetical protein